KPLHHDIVPIHSRRTLTSTAHRAVNPLRGRVHPMKRYLIFLYGIASYVVFFATFLYAIAFLGNLPGVPRTIDGPPELASGPALAIDLLLLTIFAVQHSLMARP